MAMQNVEEAAERFRKKLESGYFKSPRSVNSEEDYSAEKEDRDTKAIERFANSDVFKSLLARS